MPQFSVFSLLVFVTAAAIYVAFPRARSVIVVVLAGFVFSESRGATSPDAAGGITLTGWWVKIVFVVVLLCGLLVHYY